MELKRRLLAIMALVLCSAATAPADPIPGWTPAQIAQLRHWASTAPEDALPVPDMRQLDAAEQRGDQAALDSAATALALRVARMHLLGCATQAQRAGWRITDSDSAIDLRARLERAVVVNSIDAFFTGLRPKHPDYAALRAAYAEEADAGRRLTLARNMERWRWMPLLLGQDYVLVNAASFEARLWREGEHIGTWPVIVGKRSTPTPVFNATINGVILNPWWVVPASIVREMKGRFPASKGYVRSGGRISQRPGPGNALGQMKLDMPNRFTVYMHDTPSKHLFEREVRTFSHGCIRVGDALGLATTLLEGIKTREEVDAIVETRKTTKIKLPVGLPVYVTYFTAGMKGDGELTVMDDVYNRDGRLGDASDPGRGCGV